MSGLLGIMSVTRPTCLDGRDFSYEGVEKSPSEREVMNLPFAMVAIDT